MAQGRTKIAKKIKFKLKMAIPRTTHQQKKFTGKTGKVIAYEPNNLKQARQEFMLRLAPFKPKQEITNATVLITKWKYGTNDKYKIGRVKMTSPDTDNIIKLPKDCMTKLGFWKDDGLVFYDTIIKCWSSKKDEGIEFIIIEIPKEQETFENAMKIALEEVLKM